MSQRTGIYAALWSFLETARGVQSSGLAHNLLPTRSCGLSMSQAELAQSPGSTWCHCLSQSRTGCKSRVELTVASTGSPPVTPWCPGLETGIQGLGEVQGILLQWEPSPFVLTADCQGGDCDWCRLVKAWCCVVSSSGGKLPTHSSEMRLA